MWIILWTEFATIRATTVKWGAGLHLVKHSPLLLVQFLVVMESTSSCNQWKCELRCIKCKWRNMGEPESKPDEQRTHVWPWAVPFETVNKGISHVKYSTDLQTWHVGRNFSEVIRIVVVVVIRIKCYMVDLNFGLCFGLTMVWGAEWNGMPDL